MTDKQSLVLRTQFNEDFHRPIFHYLPPANWMNDPNGLIQWKGQYHLFYQYNPNGAYHSDMHWGHAVSNDLIHWEDLPIALAPSPNSVDENGIFSGCAINNDGQPVIFYTGVRGSEYQEQVQCKAIGSPDLIYWEKDNHNPLIGKVPPEANQTTDFRDPFVWQAENGWYMLVGSAIKDVGGTAFLYHSDDLHKWTYLNPILIGDKEQNGAIWECPNFFHLGDKWVLIISAHTGQRVDVVKYFVGDFKDHKFTPIYAGDLDKAYLYAPLTMLDEQGRRLLWGWLREGRSVEAHSQAGWAGAQAIPRQLSLDSQYRLLMTPVEELATIHGTHHHFTDIALTDIPAINIRGNSFDMTSEFEVSATGHIKFVVAASETGDECAEIIFDAMQNELRINRHYTRPDVEKDSHTRQHILDEGECLELRIILDGSILEVIANKRTSIATRIYPTQRENDFIKLTGQNAQLSRLDLYEMPSIWS